MFEQSFTNGYDIPYCQVWIGSRSGAPSLIGDSLQRLGIFSDDITARRYYTSVTVKLEARKPNTAVITVSDPYGLLDQGIHAGVPCYIKFGYSSQPGSIITRPRSRLMIVGICQRPTTDFNEDGSILLNIEVRDTTDRMRYEKKTREFTNTTRYNIVHTILNSYANSVFSQGVINFNNMLQSVDSIRQVDMTDLEFIYKLAALWGAYFDTRPDPTLNKLKFFFVDDSYKGDELLGSMHPDRNPGTVYRMDWRNGLMNVKSLKIGGEASERGEQGGFLQRGSDGRMEIVPSEVGSNDPHDPSNWELDQSKVDQWLRNNPGKTMDDFLAVAYAMPLPEMHALFFKRRSAQSFGSPIAPDSQSPSGLGAGGFKCDFELVRGDPFLEPNVPVALGGDVYNRYKSEREVGIFEARRVGGNEVWTQVKSGVLYWRTTTIEHTFNESGLHTKGSMRR